MNSNANMNTYSLLFSSSLIIISIFFSYKEKLGLEKETLIGVIRAIVQLTLVGYVLDLIFNIENPIYTTLLLLFMTLNASYNAGKRGTGIKSKFIISFLSIFLGAFITLSILLLAGTIKYEPSQMIPVGGMIISNAMIAIGLCYKQLLGNFKNKREEVEAKLALGADIKISSVEIIRDSIKTGMMPTIDSMKTLGIVALPGMMTGLILAGTSPVEAIKFQLMVTFMMLSTTSISSYLACYLAYRGFFNERKQLL
ncbi:iron export ABC transporter permease subunit FetB [Clostridium malenominatum]|uniref:Iron export ABC transporter permease subunit FetB n=1 Tax=Clostridium malenominatum TaxID=1539 RepID=A0ABN1J4Z0_9CLOT